jgi:signal peptidase I
MNAPDDAAVKGPRKPLLALAAGLVMPGLGHVYGGDFVRGVSCLLAVALAVPAVSRLALHVPVGGLCFTLFAGVSVGIALYVWSAIEAYRRVRRLDGEAPRPWQRPAVYALYAVVATVFVLAPLTRNVREGVLETFVVPSASMMPNVLPGDRIVADKTVGHVGGARLWRGALAVFVNPNDRTQIFIKRVVALPGDRVDIDGGEVRINGSPLAVPASGDDAPGVARERGDHGTYAVLRGAASAGMPAVTKLVVPDGQVFVLGDNRAVALDSRRFGTIPLADVKGIARQIWFSSGHGAGIRWGRVGRVLE